MLRRWNDRAHYASGLDWVVGVYDHLVRRFRFPMPGRRSIRRLKLRCLPDPLCFRMGSTDLLVIEEIFFTGEYRCALEGRTSAPRLIVDLGANAGYSVRFWSHHYPQARIIAVEPDAGNVRMCRMNCEAGGCLERVRLIEACVAGRQGRAILLKAEGEWSYVMADAPNSAAHTVPVMTLPQILAESGEYGCIDLLKCDIEGTEQELFGGAGRWLARAKRLVVELHPPYGLQQLRGDIRKTGVKFIELARLKSDSLVLLEQGQ